MLEDVSSNLEGLYRVETRLFCCMAVCLGLFYRVGFRSKIMS